MEQESGARVAPALTELNRPFWTGGGQGSLRFLRCADCGYYLHPPSPICRKCLSENIEGATVSGRGHVVTFTVNQQQWQPGIEPPYNVALVELVEQRGLRLTTNIVGCPPERIEIGMPVTVEFEQAAGPSEPVFVPVFRPL